MRLAEVASPNVLVHPTAMPCEAGSYAETCQIDVGVVLSAVWPTVSAILNRREPLAC